MLPRPVRRTLALAVTPVLAASALAAPAAAASTSSADLALEWFDVTAGTVAAAGAPTQVTNNRTWAIGWLAATRAVLRTPSTPRPEDYRGAAFAGAIHQTLITLAPARKAELDAALATSLARLADGPSESDGLAAGRQQAATVLADRADDGLDPASVNTPFTSSPAGAGVWQPTPPSYSPATQSGNRLARPFLLRRADQFRPGPPPAVGSERYRRDLAEVKADGSAGSTTRTPEQTATATFWLGSSYTLYTEPLRVALAATTGRSLAERAKLVALFHVAAVDTQIATSDTKYAYVSWRPVTALRAAGHAEWRPLHTTPAHPDYPSGHNTYSGSAEQVLTTLVGARTAKPYTIGSPTAPGVTRTYSTWRQLTTENVDARVWSGIHTRTADTAGVTLGRQVAAHAVREAYRLFR
ncbi:phosphoesterase PA-phosphatase related protein [Kribbella flavida DSM 17836]|uniref:Phosphoesterase PA-phosphatase related protein n=1 Tax=Kribbella flavida (strain DSM 17836 / JCM 10339 / NBRC 14399) TaxID=479435 RepID=D2PVD5_KRIFD|nr:vanadium-dependent haloperoxidase [Kribbella flavida]ADB33416.1 phosphoesterase PA-phosphatase related protein [Kribbella flavida DSM 17836]